MVVSEAQVELQLPGATYKDFDKMDDVMGHAWVEDSEEVWRLAAVRSVSSDGETLFVLDTDGETVYTVGKDKSHPFDPSHAIDMDDLAYLNNMHEAPLLHVLQRRFKGDHIYTVCSDVLISINPYKRIPLLYDLDKTTGTPLNEQAHREHDADGKPRVRGASRPHVYSVAERAFRFMTEPKEALLLGKQVALKNQSIIISGESGAGKTEASKYVMRYLITVANALHSDEGRQEQQHGDLIEKCLLRSNLVLEAFGNAKTLRNDNSSRFGKYIKLQYDGKRHLIGAWTDHFLLEKSRLVHVDWDERNYHVFYQMLRGLPSDTLQALHLSGDPEDYTMLSQGGCCSLEDVDDAQDLAAVAEALHTLDLSEEEVSCLWRLLAVLLHLGNLEYQWDEDENREVQLLSPKVDLSVLAEMVGTTPLELRKGICSRSTSSARGSTLCIPLNLEQTRNNVQALIKYAYGEVFQWLVRKINACHSNMSSGRRAASFIGILDIFGFEIMTRNSFEQLCINFANEVLQQQFNMHVFVLEQQEYVAEELDWSVISFRDNQPVIDMISKKPTGLLIMLEEQGMLARKANNDGLLTSFHNTHLGKIDCYAKPRFASDEFIIRHFAGEVTYSVSGLIEKNNDSLHKDLLLLLHNSDVPFFRNLVSPTPTPNTPGYIRPLPSSQAPSSSSSSSSSLDLDGPQPQRRGGEGRGPQGGPPSSSRGPPPNGQRNVRGRDNMNVRETGPSAICHGFTVSATFRRQLDDLTSTLKATEPHYIKCIKPNGIKASGGFSPRLVVQQLRYSGVLEVVRIRREAYPTRIPFEEFYRRFDVLLGSAKPPAHSLKCAKDYRTACQSIVVRVLPPGGFQLGKRKIFLRDNGLDVLRAAIRDFFAGHASVIQAQMRTFIYSRRYKTALRRIRLLQRRVRMHLLRKRFLRHRRQIVLVQTAYRRSHARRLFLRLRAAALLTQTNTRRFLALKTFSRRARAAQQQAFDAATTIASLYRGHRARTSYRRTRAAMAISSLYRGVKARRAVRRLRAAMLLQRMLRGWVARRHFTRLRSVALIVAQLRGLVARCRYRRLRSAHLILAHMRGLVARRHYRQLRAAIKLQARYRGHRARAHYTALRARALILATLRGYVARQAYARDRRRIVVTQACYRRHVARREAKTLRAVVRLQSAARAWAARAQFASLRTMERIRREREERVAACKLQACWMGYCLRHEFLALRAATIIAQTSVRGFLARAYKLKALRSIVVLQTHLRGHACRVAYARQRAAILLQASARGLLCRLAYAQLRAAICLQTFYRCHSARLAYLRLRATITLQALTRGTLARLAYARLRATITIQAAFRGHAQRRRTTALRAAITLQAHLRGLFARRAYRRLRGAITIQSLARGHKARRHYARLRAAVKLQSVVRMWVARKAYLRLRAIVLVQSIFRRGVARRTLRRQRYCIRVIQRHARRFLTHTLVASRVSSLHKAAAAGQVQLVARMLMDKPRLACLRNARDRNRTLLHAACLSDDMSVLSFLNPCADDLLTLDDEGSSPFLLACARGCLDVVKKCGAICDRTPADVTDLSTPRRNPRPSPAPTSTRGASFLPNASSQSSQRNHKAAAHFAQAGATPETLDDRLKATAEALREQQATHMSMQEQRQNGYVTPLASVRSSRANMNMNMNSSKGPMHVPGGGSRFSGAGFTPASIAEVRTLAMNPTAASEAMGRIRCGWLRKRRETDRWQRRYVILTNTDLTYAHDVNSRVTKRISLRYAMLRMCDRIDFCFEIHSPLLLDRRNREGRLYFQAEDEMELQAWYNSLRGVTGHVSHMCGRRAAPIRYANLLRRHHMVKGAANKLNETPLHVVVKAVTGQQRQSILLAAWLLENGADPNAADAQGNTPAHLAAVHGAKEPLARQLLRLLLLRGADDTRLNRRGQRLQDLVQDWPAEARIKEWDKTVNLMRAWRMTEDGGKVLDSPSSRAASSPRAAAAMAAQTPRHRVVYARRPAPTRMPGCSYVSVFLERLTMQHKRILDMPYLLVTVYSPKGHVVEPPQRLAHPALYGDGSKHVLWGLHWHMYTPIENLTPGTFAVIEFHDLRGYDAKALVGGNGPPSSNGHSNGPNGPSKGRGSSHSSQQRPPLSSSSGAVNQPPPQQQQPKQGPVTETPLEDVMFNWTIVHLDDGSVDSAALNREMYSPPVDLRLKRLEPSDCFLSGDVVVSRTEMHTFSHD